MADNNHVNIASLKNNVQQKQQGFPMIFQITESDRERERARGRETEHTFSQG